MTGPDAPPAPVDASAHADWLEIIAVSSGHSRSSPQDLIRKIRQGGSVDADEAFDDLDDDRPLDDAVEREDEILESKADDAFELLASRKDLLGDAYPFEVEQRAGSLAAATLRADPDAAASPYMFLTALTHTGLLPDGPESGASLFEQVSRAALVSYLGGTARVRFVDFGFPRRGGPPGFTEAIGTLCREFGAGLEPRKTWPGEQRKDGGLDFAVWVPFVDERFNRLSVLGHCASGRNWRTKLNELLPYDFCSAWFNRIPSPAPLSAFFIPRQVHDSQRAEVEVSAHRLFFDRLRMAPLLDSLDGDLASRCAAWTATAIDL